MIVSLFVSVVVFCSASFVVNASSDIADVHTCMHSAANDLWGPPLNLLGDEEISSVPNRDKRLVRFRIADNYYTLDDMSNKTCINVGDVISVDQFGDYTCLETDLWTQKRRDNIYIIGIIATNLIEDLFYPLPRLSSPVNMSNVADCHGVQIPPSYTSIFDGGDVLVIFTARPTTPLNDDAVSVSSVCYTIFSVHRPFIARLNVAIQRIPDRDLTDAERNFFVATLVHEYGHILGFNSDLYPYFKNPPTINRSLYDGTNSSRYVWATPGVLDLARRHYSCAALNGAELEDLATPFDIASHWEQRLLFEDVMTPSLSFERWSASTSYFSAFTLSLLKDSGWYQLVDEVSLPHITFGKGRGCDFTDASCSTWIGSGSPERQEVCNDLTSSNDQCAFGVCPLRCSYDRRSVGMCNQRYQSNSTLALSQWQLFDSRVSSVDDTVQWPAGTNAFADYCPTYSTGGWSCSDSDAKGTLWGGYAGPNVFTRCATTNEYLVDAGSNPGHAFGQCYVMACGADGAVSITAFYGTLDVATKRCNTDGQKLSFTSDSTSIQVTCPPRDIICPYATAVLPTTLVLSPGAPVGTTFNVTATWPLGVRGRLQMHRIVYSSGGANVPFTNDTLTQSFVSQTIDVITLGPLDVTSLCNSIGVTGFLRITYDTWLQPYFAETLRSASVGVFPCGMASDECASTSGSVITLSNSNRVATFPNQKLRYSTPSTALYIRQCSGNTAATGSDLWYHVKSTINGVVSVSICDVATWSSDVTISLFSRTCANPSCVTLQPQRCKAHGSKITFTVAAGTVYHVLVTGRENDIPFTLSVALT